MTSAKETRYQNNQRELNCSSNSRSYQEANHSKLSRRDFEILNTSRGFSNNLSTSQIFQRFLKSFLKFSKILLRISNTLWDFKIFKFLQDFWGLNRLLRFSRNYQKIFESFVSFVGGSFWDIFRFWKIFRMFVRISKNLLRVLRSSKFSEIFRIFKDLDERWMGDLLLGSYFAIQGWSWSFPVIQGHEMLYADNRRTHGIAVKKQHPMCISI